MPNEEIASETSETEEAPPKKKSRKLLLIAVLVILVAAGGGGGFYFWKHRGASKANATKENSAEKDKEKRAKAEPADGEVKQVIELQPFIVNLSDKNESRYLRMTISLGVGDSGEGKVDPLFTTKVRNAILAVITNKTSEEVLTVEGKAELRREMLKAAAAAADKPAVQTIYITDYIVQM